MNNDNKLENKIENEQKETISYPFNFQIKRDPLCQRIDIFKKREFPHNWESLGFNQEINDTKNKIENLSVCEWNKIRKIVNPFDFPNIFNYRLKIFNRAFYKFWEIFHQFDLDKYYQQQENKKSLHLAEAPGSFIHVLLFKKSLFQTQEKEESEDGFVKVKTRKNKRKNKEKYIDTVSIRKPGFPKYNEQILNSAYVNFLDEQIGNRTGDICQKQNLYELISIEQKYHIITADGGIDEKGHYDSKEQIHLKLFLVQILIALNKQKEEGVFVLKIYDIFTQATVDLIWILSQFYETVHLYKPLTSRITNSEKYLICKGFKSSENNIVRLTEQILSFLDEDDNIQVINFEVKPKPSPEFKKQFKTINKHISTLQIESINKALNLVNKPLNKQLLDEQNIIKSKNFVKWKNTFGLYEFLE